jgi:fumarylpyruvate hydrolase
VAGDSSVFPVRRVYCVGRNYAEHAAEMGADRREPPFFFSKPADALVPGGGDVAYPPARPTSCSTRSSWSSRWPAAAPTSRRRAPWRASTATPSVIDLTRRDLQQRAKDKGHPWDMGKGFDQSAPVSAIQPVAAVGHPAQGAIWLKVNGTVAPERRPRADDLESRRSDRQPVDPCQARRRAT